MKVINCNKNYFENKDVYFQSTNFVDENNVVLGFSDDSQCSEDFGWIIAEKIPQSIKELDELRENPIDESVVIDHNFDKEFFYKSNMNYYEEGGCAAFKLECNGKPNYFIILWNFHNGYYSHGFAFSIDEVVKVNDSL